MRADRPIRHTLALAATLLAAGGTLAAPAVAGQPGAAGLPGSSGTGSTPAAPAPSGQSGGAGLVAASTPISTPAHPTVPGLRAKIIHGVAYAPAEAPIQIQRAIWAGDKIRHKPYIYGGGHASFTAAGYDCSGSVSYVLHAAGLLKRPMDSSDLLSWGTGGLGQWITVYTNPGHAFVEIAGIRLDTSSEGDLHATSGSGPRWRTLLRDPQGYTARHPSGF